MKCKRFNPTVLALLRLVKCLSTSGQGKTQSKGAYPGDGGSQTRPGTGLPGVPVQSHFNTGESPGSW